MICANCKTDNEAGSNFCKNCANNLVNPFAKQKTTSAIQSDNLLFIFIVLSFAITAVTLLIRFLIPNWYDGIFKYITGLLWIIDSVILILIPFCIVNQKQRVIAFILAGLLILQSVIGYFDFFSH